MSCISTTERSGAATAAVPVASSADDPFVQKLRRADRCVLLRRQEHLQQKIRVIEDEVRDIMSPMALSELEIMLNQVSSRIAPIADRTMLENLTADYNRKKDAICLHVEVENQQKIKALFDFVDGMKAFGSSDTGGSTDKDADADASDITGSAAAALETCDRLVTNANVLEEQYQLLLGFHKEFKDHIFKGV